MQEKTDRWNIKQVKECIIPSAETPQQFVCFIQLYVVLLVLGLKLVAVYIVSIVHKVLSVTIVQYEHNIENFTLHIQGQPWYVLLHCVFVNFLFSFVYIKILNMSYTL